MNRFAFIIVFILLIVPHICLAQGYSVDASSYNWMANRSYSPYMLADDDPSTTWAEGGKGAGVGEWVSFNFEVPVNLARIGIRNGDQRQGDWERCNRVKDVRVEYGHGRLKEATLKNAPELQYVDIAADVEELKLTILSFYPAENFWTRGVTCISDVIFESFQVPATAATQAPVQEAEPKTSATDQAVSDEQAASEEQPKAAAAPPAADQQAELVTTVPERPEVVLKPVRLPEPADEEPALETKTPGKKVADNSKKTDWKDVLPGPDSRKSSEPEPEEVAEKSSGETAEASEPAPAAEPKGATTPVLNMSDPEGAAIEIVRQYYLRLNTLDKTFPDLMAREMYEQELLSFLYFEEIQKQLGTASTLRKAEVDLSDLTISIRKMYEREARVTSVGTYAIATPGQRLEVEEDARFVLILEEGVWKIKKKTDE